MWKTSKNTFMMHLLHTRAYVIAILPVRAHTQLSGNVNCLQLKYYMYYDCCVRRDNRSFPCVYVRYQYDKQVSV